MSEIEKGRDACISDMILSRTQEISSHAATVKHSSKDIGSLSALVLNRRGKIKNRNECRTPKGRWDRNAKEALTHYVESGHPSAFLGGELR